MEKKKNEIRGPQLLEKGTSGREMLEFACTELTKLTGGTVHTIQDVYEDIEADIKWSTIVTNDSGNNSYQLLSPRDWLILVNGPDERTLPLISKLAREHL